MSSENDSKIPTPALVLGVAGLAPFFAGAVGLWLFDSAPRREATLQLLLTYCAVILAFMGAIHWGMVMIRSEYATRGPMIRAVLPALLAWAALALPPLASMAAFLIGFPAVLAMDLHAVNSGLAPRWYRRLRIPLTLAVVACLGTAMAALGSRSPT